MDSSGVTLWSASMSRSQSINGFQLALFWSTNSKPLILNG